jgi:hypothetical protein
MVNISNSPPPSPIPKPGNRTSSVEASASTNREKQAETVTHPFVERRKNNRDRRAQKSARGPFDMRAGRDRRKNSGGRPSVEEEV